MAQGEIGNAGIYICLAKATRAAAEKLTLQHAHRHSIPSRSRVLRLRPLIVTLLLPTLAELLHLYVRNWSA